jgi:hypothetical protein
MDDPKCKICGGCGFLPQGGICSCITGEAKIPDSLKAMFGDIFKDKNHDNEAKAQS